MATWGIRVYLGGADISGRLTDEATIDAERNKARVCEFSYRPTGATSRRELEGVTLTIDLHAGGAWVRRFTGRVLTATQDRSTGVFRVMGQDTRKAQANGASLLTIIGWCADGGGLYAEEIFGPRSTGMRQLEDVASTTWGTVECGPDDLMRWHTWAPSSTPDVTFARYLKGTLEEGTIDLDSLVNRWVLTFQWRYTRLWARAHTLSWDWGQEWCDHVYPPLDGWRYWQNPYGLPNVSDVLGFDGKAGWKIQVGAQRISMGDPTPFSYEMLPASGWYNCDGGSPGTGTSGLFHWSITDQGRQDSLTQFAVRFARFGAQTVTRTYVLTVDAPQSIARYGARTATESASGETPYDATAWTDAAGSGVPADGFGSNGIGDNAADMVAEVVVELAGACYLRSKLSALRAAHRRPLSFDEPLALAVELDSTVRLDQPGHVAAQGPVQRITDSLRFPAEENQWQGRATTRIALAQSRSTTDAQADDELLLPAAPSTQPTHTPHADTTVLGTHVGRWDGCPDWDDEGMIGWRANRETLQPPDFDPPDPDPREYVEGFRFSLPDIEPEMTDEVVGTTAATYAVSIPHDELSDGD